MRSIQKRELFIQAWEIAKSNFSMMLSIGLFLFGLFLLGSIIEGFFTAEEISGIMIPTISAPYIIYKIFFLCMSHAIFLGVCAQMINLVRNSEVESLSNIFGYTYKTPIKIASMLIVKSIFFILGIIFILLFIGTTDINVNEVMKMFVYDFLGIMNFDSSEKIIEMIVVDNVKIGALIAYLMIMIYLFIKSDFFSYFIIDKDYGAWEAVKASFIKTNGLELELFIVYIMLFLINILGGFLFGIGLLFTMPFSWLVLTLAYTKYLND